MKELDEIENNISELLDVLKVHKLSQPRMRLELVILHRRVKEFNDKVKKIESNIDKAIEETRRND